MTPGNARALRSTAYLLEPELKDGGGDIHAFGWLRPGRSLEDDGLLRSAERAQLMRPKSS
jgi:hypothetical protein